MSGIEKEIAKEVFESLDKEFAADPKDGITIHKEDWRTVVKYMQDQARTQHGADSGEAVAWVSPLVYGRQVTFYKPTEPEGWEDDELGTEWYCRPLVYADTKPPANQVPKEPTEAMLKAAMSSRDRQHPENAKRYLRNVWKQMLSAQPDAGAGQWIPCSERLPTKDDEDADGKVWLCWPHREFIERVERRTTSFCDGFWWMRTGLRKPQPPEVE